MIALHHKTTSLHVLILDRDASISYYHGKNYAIEFTQFLFLMHSWTMIS